MNKNLIVVVLAVLILGVGIFYRTVVLKGSVCSEGQGNNVVIDMTTKEGKWEFSPSDIKVEKCDNVTLNIFNEDDYDHGFAIDVFGVNKRLIPQETTTINFKASKSGEFTFYCSVPCGQGHFSHKGITTVLDIAE